MLLERYEFETKSGVFKTSFKLPMPGVTMLCIQPLEKEFIAPRYEKPIGLSLMLEFMMGKQEA